MPTAPPRPCPEPHCPNLDCREHQRPAWRTRTGPPVVRITGRRLQRMRAALFARSPWCAHCLEQGQETRATIRDHIVPLAEGGTEDPSNIQALCLDCSDLKTAAESKRGAASASMTPSFRKRAVPRGVSGRFTERRRAW